MQGKLRALEIVRVQQAIHLVIHGGGTEISINLTNHGVFTGARQFDSLAQLVVLVRGRAGGGARTKLRLPMRCTNQTNR